MARDLTVKDAYVLMNAVAKQATGQTNITVVDASTFVSAGEKVLATGMDNVFNAITTVLNRTIVAARPYKARLDLMEETNTGAYSTLVREISFYSQDALPSGYFNTDLYTNLADGFTAGQNPDTGNNPQSTKSQWEQHQAMPMELFFGGSSTWQDCVTLYEEKVKQAFRSPEDFNAFVSGYLTEHANDIETQREAWNRVNLLNKIGSVYDMQELMPGSVINLTKAFNDRFGTSYTSAQLRSTYMEQFLKFFVSTFKNVSDFMTERSANYHWSVPKVVGDKTYKVLRHTPYANQRVYLYEPLFTEARAWVMPDIFNPDRLDIKKQYQPVTYWQSVNDRAAVKVTPAVVDPNTGLQKAGTAVDLPYVVGMITDERGLVTNMGFEVARTTPVEARKGYRNTWLTFLKNSMNNNTHNCVLFIMKDPDPGK